jgi:hypothetical protein
MKKHKYELLKLLRCICWICVIVFGSITIAAIIGCGGGGDASVQTGRFMDGPVSGLYFQTATQSGQTNANGEFFYLGGEIVSFYVGNILIGQATGAAMISPFELAGESPPTSGADIHRAVNRSWISNVATPFSVALNIALFLQTLDEDGNTANGIQIPAQMHNLATGVNLDFKQMWYEFRYDFSFRELIAAGRAAGLWGGVRAIRYWGYAMDDLYDGLGLTPSIEAVSTVEWDDDGDGTVDRGTTYDANGNQTLYETDDDGTVDRRWAYTYVQINSWGYITGRLLAG